MPREEIAFQAEASVQRSQILLRDQVKWELEIFFGFNVIKTKNSCTEKKTHYFGDLKYKEGDTGSMKGLVLFSMEETWACLKS